MASLGVEIREAVMPPAESYFSTTRFRLFLQFETSAYRRTIGPFRCPMGLKSRNGDAIRDDNGTFFQSLSVDVN